MYAPLPYLQMSFEYGIFKKNFPVRIFDNAYYTKPAVIFGCFLKLLKVLDKSGSTFV